MTAHDLHRLLGSFRFSPVDEAELQEAIEGVLVGARVPFTREAVLGEKDRVDFLVGDVALEVKVDGSAPVVARQLLSYAQHEAVRELLLVTTRQKHARLPSHLGHARLFILHVGGL